MLMKNVTFLVHSESDVKAHIYRGLVHQMSKNLVFQNAEQEVFTRMFAMLLVVLMLFVR